MRKDPTEFRERFKRWKQGLPAYKDGKRYIKNDDNTWTRITDDQMADLFANLVVTPNANKEERVVRRPDTYDALLRKSIHNAGYVTSEMEESDATNRRKVEMAKRHVEDPLETVSPEFDILLGGRLIVTSLFKPKTIFPKNAIKRTDADWDAAYMKAVKSGDMNEVLRLRDLHFTAKSQGNKAVREDGMPSIAYHTVQDQYNPNFTIFNPNIEGSNSAIYTSSDPLMSGTYTNKIVSEYERNQLAELMRINELRNIEQGHAVGGSAQLRKAILQDPERGRDWIVRNTWLNQPIEPARQKQLYINLQNPVLVDNGGRSWNNIDLSLLYDNYSDVYKSIRPHGLLGQGYSTRSLEAAQREAGIYDGAIIRNVADYGGSRKSSILDWSKGNDIYMVNSPNRVKLADPITYDDAGNIIPLSKRDNFSIGDIRYLLPYAIGGTAIYGAHGIQK